MRNLLLSFVFAGFLATGIRAPFLLALGYIWIDLMSPQLLSYSLLTQIPVSQLMGGGALLALFFVPKDSRPRWPAQTWILVVFGLWMTLTLAWAVAPAESAEIKWNNAIKTLIFCSILPGLIRTRMQVEAGLWILTVSGISHCIAAGMKTAINGGGYGESLGLIESNSGFGEGSTLSMFAVMLIPLCAYLGRYNTLLPCPRLLRYASWAGMATCVLTAVGTHARTGLVCMAMVALLWTFSTRNVLRNALVVALAAAAVYHLADASWFARMGTTGDDTEGSAMQRVAVWQWVLGFVERNPLGGSFNMFVTSDASITLSNGMFLSANRLSYHSIYFEVLGEGGVPGALLYLTLLLSTLFGLSALRRRAKRQARVDPALRGQADADMALCIALRNCLLIFLSGGAFIGVGFQSLFYLVVMLAASFINVSKAPRRATSDASVAAHAAAT